MTANEKKIMQELEADSWNEMVAYRYNYTIRNIDKSVGYVQACSQLDSLEHSVRLTERWCDIRELLKKLGIEVDYSKHKDYSHKLWEYFNDKD